MPWIRYVAEGEPHRGASEHTASSKGLALALLGPDFNRPTDVLVASATEHGGALAGGVAPARRLGSLPLMPYPGERTGRRLVPVALAPRWTANPRRREAPQILEPPHLFTHQHLVGRLCPHSRSILH